MPDPLAPDVFWPSFLRELDATETAWNARPVKYPRADAVPWMPYSIPQFVSMLTEAMMVAAPGTGPAVASGQYGPPRFLDVGCGPGTKIRLAQAMFGVAGFGIDIVPRFIAEAQAHGISAVVKDAFEFPAESTLGTYPGYADFQIVCVNRPSSLQDELEHLIMDRMAPDAVLMAINWKHNPGKEGWIAHSEEYGEPVCGVFIKP